MTGAGDDHGHAAHGHGGHAHDHGHGGHAHLSHVPDASRPAVYAARAGLVFEPPARSDQVEHDLTRFFAGLSTALAGAGCTLVGHIKGTLAAVDDDGGGLAFHSTMLGTAPAITDGFADGVIDATLTINVIVFGVDEQRLPALVHDAWSGAVRAVTTWLD